MTLAKHSVRLANHSNRLPKHSMTLPKHSMRLGISSMTSEKAGNLTNNGEHLYKERVL